MKTQKEQYQEYQNNGGTMNIQEWVMDGRYDAYLSGEKSDYRNFTIQKDDYGFGAVNKDDPETCFHNQSKNGCWIDIDDWWIERLSDENTRLKKALQDCIDDMNRMIPIAFNLDPAKYSTVINAKKLL